MSTDRGSDTRSTTNKQQTGFAVMDPEKQREIASKGGKASAEGDTSNRGFASMDSEKQHEIAKKGGQARAAQMREDKDLADKYREENAM